MCIDFSQIELFQFLINIVQKQTSSHYALSTAGNICAHDWCQAKSDGFSQVQSHVELRVARPVVVFIVKNIYIY